MAQVNLPSPPPPPFSPAFEASLLLPLPPLPPLLFDPLAFVTLNFPSSSQQHSSSTSAASASSYAGLLTQVTRAITATISKRASAQQPDSTEDHVQLRTGVGQVVEVCLELLESVKVMKELEEESINRREQAAARSRDKEGSERKSNTPSTPKTPPSTTSSSSSSSSSSSTSSGSSSISQPQTSGGGLTGSFSADFQALNSLRLHLVATIRSLRSLSLLIAAIDALPLLFPSRDYPAISKLLAYISRLQAALASYSSLPLLASLSSHRSTHLLSLQRLILQDLYTALPKLPADADVDSLALRVSLLDQYIPSVREELIQWFSQCRLQPFLAKCSTTASASPHSPASPSSPATRFSSITQVEEMYKLALYMELVGLQHRLVRPRVPRALAHAVPPVPSVHAVRSAAHTDHARGPRGEGREDRPLQAAAGDAGGGGLPVCERWRWRTRSATEPWSRRWEWKGLISSAFHPYIHSFVVMEQEKIQQRHWRKIEREEQWLPTEVAEGTELGRG